MKLLESKKFKIPKVFLVTNSSEIKDIPLGVPFIYADEGSEEYLVRLLEYEVLYREALKSGYPFNFRKILEDNGYGDLKELYYNHPIYVDYKTEGTDCDVDLSELKQVERPSDALKDFVIDNAAYVDIEVLKGLNVFPLWLDDIEKAVNTNIHNFATFNNNLYNKKLEGMYGGLEFNAPKRNLIIIDISGSIPKAVSSTCLTLAKNLSESFYSDILITGSKSTLYKYEELYKLNVENIYAENEMDNDQVWFKKLLTEQELEYKTAIVFGDNDSPCYNWNNTYNKKTRRISREDGKKLCKWKIDNLISLHTSPYETDKEKVAGYADWFTPKNTQYVKDWVKYLK
jgi:hypothetical protein